MPSNSKNNSQFYQNELYDYLSKNRAKDEYTHTSLGTPKGSYYLKLSESDAFLELYYKVAFEQKIPVYLTEGIRDLENTPLKIDLDFRYYAKDPARVYTLEDIKLI